MSPPYSLLNATCAARACAAYGDEAVAEQLMANHGYVDQEKNSVLIAAASNGHDRLVEKLLLLRDVDVNQRNSLGCTPLFMAALKGHDKVVELLMRIEGIDPNRAMRNGFTPLNVACFNGHYTVVELLVGREDVQVNKSDVNGKTPLMGAAYNGHTRVVELLLGRDGIEVGPDREGETALYMAEIRGHAGAAQLLRGRLLTGGSTPRYDERATCVACLDSESEVELVPCGHRVLCGACAHSWFNRQLGCPVDRIKVAEIIPLEAAEEGEK